MRISRTIATLTAGTLATGALIATTATPANAAGVSFNYSHNYRNNYSIAAVVDGVEVSWVDWNRDTNGPYAGDTLCVQDAEADGKYITGYLDTGRKISTKGSHAPTDSCKPGNIKEDVKHWIRMCVTWKGAHACSRKYTVYS